jgi:hypothetical protein
MTTEYISELGTDDRAYTQARLTYIVAELHEIQSSPNSATKAENPRTLALTFEQRILKGNIPNTSLTAGNFELNDLANLLKALEILRRRNLGSTEVLERIENFKKSLVPKTKSGINGQKSSRRLQERLDAKLGRPLVVAINGALESKLVEKSYMALKAGDSSHALVAEMDFLITIIEVLDEQVQKFVDSIDESNLAKLRDGTTITLQVPAIPQLEGVEFLVNVGGNRAATRSLTDKELVDIVEGANIVLEAKVSRAIRDMNQLGQKIIRLELNVKDT